MAEEKKIEIPAELQQNVMITPVIVECVVTKDGKSFFIMKNVKGEPIRILDTPEDVATFFSKLIDSCSYE